MFTNMLAVRYSEGLIEKTTFAIDGCKISSNCLNESSGSKAELHKTAEKLERSVAMVLDTHRQQDASLVRDREDVTCFGTLSSHYCVQDEALEQWNEQGTAGSGQRRRLM